MNPEIEKNELTETVVPELSDSDSTRRGTPNPKLFSSAANSTSPVMLKAVQAVMARPLEGHSTLLTRKFFNVLVKRSQAAPRNAAGYFEIALTQLCSDAHYESRNMVLLADHLQQMVGTVVTWGDTPDKLGGRNRSWHAAALLTYVRIYKGSHGPTRLDFDFHPEVSQKLLDPEVYTALSLEILGRFRRHGGMVLYEVGQRYLSNKNGLTGTLPWRDWRAMLTGVPASKDDSPEYKYFKRDTLTPCLQEVNRVQDGFTMRVLEGRVGRSVETLQFVVDKRARAPGLLKLDDFGDLSLIGRLVNFGVAQAAAERLYAEHGSVRLKRCLDEMTIRLSNTRLAPVENIAAYVRKLLAEGAFPEPLPVTERLPETAPASGEDDETLIQGMRAHWLDYQRRLTEQLFSELPVGEKTARLDEFWVAEGTNQNGVTTKAWNEFRAKWPTKGELVSGLIRPVFFRWLLRTTVPEPTERELLVFISKNPVPTLQGSRVKHAV